ncbi:hypothetical protein ACFL27_16605 [candidate division CSSED10-310 bacterium]|uniref:Uncharacterized protein n=1 Tax=candidate division CSSED10-310 bacterium TaxID=2855610 RepID=A0ABV6Z047_UNCC1
MKVKTKIFVQQPAGIELVSFLEAVSLKCDGVQLYLNEANKDSIPHWQEVREHLDRFGLSTMVHLRPDYSLADLRAARVLAGDLGIYIIHYEQSQSLQPLPWGILGLENALFGINSRYHYIWLHESTKVGRIPVFDIPRLFKESDPEKAHQEMLNVLDLLDHYILHLIDFKDQRQDRSDFVPLGQGILSPYLQQITWKKRPMAVVLEFEDLEQSFQSFPFVNSLFGNS